MGRRPFALAAVALSIAGLACHEKPGAARDAAAEGISSDGPSALTLEIAVTGCASKDPSVPLCTGQPPLGLSFSPVGSQDLTQFHWDFGDGAPASTDRAPAHAYAHPGTYTVVLKAGAMVGTVMAPPLTVEVQPIAAGAPCEIDDQCADGLTCVCAPGSGCASSFIRGVCSTSCASTPCPSGATCGVVAVGSENAGAPAARCFGACDMTAQCPPGFVCQTVPAGSTEPGGPRWTRACLPLGLVNDLGGSCRNADDVLVDSACASGLCADQGALGVCTATCTSTGVCPAGSACVDDQRRCLLTCQTDGDCTPDPLLACVTLAEAAPIVPSDAVVNVCATRPCSSDAACAPSGHCGPDGLCVRGPR